MTFSPRENPLRWRPATFLGQFRVGGRDRVDCTLTPCVESVRFVNKRLDTLTIQDVLDALLNAAEESGDAIRIETGLAFLDKRSRHFPDVVVKLNQIDEHWPQHVQEQVLLVLLKLGVQAIDDLLALAFGPKLALEHRLEARNSVLECSIAVSTGDKSTDIAADGDQGALRIRSLATIPRRCRSSHRQTRV